MYLFLVLIIFSLNTKLKDSISMEHAKLRLKTRTSQFNVIYTINQTMFFCVDISSAEYEKLKLITMP